MVTRPRSCPQSSGPAVRRLSGQSQSVYPSGIPAPLCSESATGKCTRKASWEREKAIALSLSVVVLNKDPVCSWCTHSGNSGENSTIFYDFQKSSKWLKLLSSKRSYIVVHVHVSLASMHSRQCVNRKLWHWFSTADLNSVSCRYSSSIDLLLVTGQHSHFSLCLHKQSLPALNKHASLITTDSTQLHFLAVCISPNHWTPLERLNITV